MPAVERKRARELDAGAPAATTGELSYLLAEQVRRYTVGHALNGSTIGDVIAALESTKSEFVRRVAEPYELAKLTDDVDDPLYAIASIAQREHIRAMRRASERINRAGGAPV